MQVVMPLMKLENEPKNLASGTIIKYVSNKDKMHKNNDVNILPPGVKSSRKYLSTLDFR